MRAYFRKEPKMTRVILAGLVASCLLALSPEATRAEEPGASDRLPEPALRFAKEASERVADMEQGWKKLAEALTKNQADFALTDGSANSLQEQSSRLLSAARGLLEDQKRLTSDFERFKDTLRKAAGHYSEVAALYKAQALQARAREIRDDYLTLSSVYEAKAKAAGDRVATLSIPADAKAKAEVIEEGNLFLERFAEALSIGPVSATDQDRLAERLRKHGDRCQALATELSQAIEKLLETQSGESDSQKQGERTSQVRSADAKPKKKDLSFLNGSSWSASATIQGVKCRITVRFEANGNCYQTLQRTDSRGRTVKSGVFRASFETDSDGYITFSQRGLAIERGEVTRLGNDSWSYELLASLACPELVGTKHTFFRDNRP
jgi:hypothetical protein